MERPEEGVIASPELPKTIRYVKKNSFHKKCDHGYHVNNVAASLKKTGTVVPWLGCHKSQFKNLFSSVIDTDQKKFQTRRAEGIEASKITSSEIEKRKRWT